MKLALLLLLSVAAARTQTMQPVDLSGSWRYSEGDDARYADPGFNDEAWKTVHLPGANFLRELLRDRWTLRYFWLRKTVDIPEAAVGQPLALTLGKLTENYTVFLNGKQVGQVGNFTIRDSKLARPEVFDLPPLDTRHLTIAIRAWIHDGRAASTAHRYAQDTGPYSLTPAAYAQRNLGEVFVNNLLLTRTLDLVVGVSLVSLSLIPMLMYLGQPKRMELLWLALQALFVGIRRLLVVILIRPDSRPWEWHLITSPLHRAFLLEFVLAALAIRNQWLRVMIWAGAAMEYASPGGLRFAQLLSVAVPLWAIRQPHASRLEKWIILGGSLLVTLTGIRQDSPADWMESLPAAFLRIGPYNISLHSPLTALLTLVMILVLTRRLLTEAAEKQRMQGELEAARLMQQIMVKSVDAAAGFRIDSAYVPAQEVGGDFYQVLPLPDGAALVIVGDVSGKGLRAAMVVSLLTGAIANRRNATPAAVLAELNQVLCSHYQGGFATAVCLRLEPDGRVQAASAGHPAPYCDGQEVAMENGLPLGVSPESSYEETALPAGYYTLVSDGVIEAANATGELFSFERTAAISTKPAKEIAAAAQAWGQNDDITVVTVQRSS